MTYSNVENIDCMVGMKPISDKFFDWAIVDIPYGINVGKMAFTQEVKTSVKQKNGTRLKVKKEKYALKDWDSKAPGQEYFDELCRVSKNQIIFGVEYVDWNGLGPGRIQWNKLVPKGLSFKPYEMAYCSSIDYTHEINLLWSGMNQAKSVNYPTIMQGNKRLNEKRIHPTHKPKTLYQILYQTFLTPFDKILDTHLGGGSSRIVAEAMGFYFKAFEIDKYYFERQEERFLKETQKPLFDQYLNR